jgi:ATP synthase protein I
MSDEPTSKSSKAGRTFAEEVGARAARKLRAQRHPTQVWSGLGMMGLVGWSVAIPTLLGAALGLWLDGRYSSHSFTLSLLVAGLVLGCLNAWHWVAAQDKTMREPHEDGDE